MSPPPECSSTAGTRRCGRPGWCCGTGPAASSRRSASRPCTGTRASPPTVRASSRNTRHRTRRMRTSGCSISGVARPAVSRDTRRPTSGRRGLLTAASSRSHRRAAEIRTCTVYPWIIRRRRTAAGGGRRRAARWVAARRTLARRDPDARRRLATVVGRSPAGAGARRLSAGCRAESGVGRTGRALVRLHGR